MPFNGKYNVSNLGHFSIGNSVILFTPIKSVASEDNSELPSSDTSNRRLHEMSRDFRLGNEIAGNLPDSSFRWRFRCKRVVSFSRGLMSEIKFYRKYN